MTALNRSGARRGGDHYQDLFALEVLIDWVRHPSRYQWIELEADQAGALDDVTALKSDGTLVVKQIKWTSDSDKHSLSWSKLLDKDSNKPKQRSWLEKWSASYRDLSKQYSCVDASVCTNRIPDPVFARLLTEKGYIDTTKLDTPLRETLTKHFESVQQLKAFFTSFEFNADHPDYAVKEEALLRKFEDVGGNSEGFNALLLAIPKWSSYKGKQIILEEIKEAAQLTDYQRLHQRFRQAASVDVDRSVKAHNVGYTVELGLSIQKNEKKPDEEKSIDHSQLCELLNQHAHIVIQAEPGTGKSTILRQLATLIKNADTDQIPVLLSLPYLATAHKGIIEALVERDSFSKFKVEDFRELAREGVLVLLCDGWNEISAEKRQFVRENIEQFMCDYSDTGIVITSRPNTEILPINDTTTVHLSVLTYIQQQTIMTHTLGEKGITRLVHARSIPRLADLLSIPFYLNVFCTVGDEVTLAENKEQLIAQFIRYHESQQNHQTALVEFFEGEHDHYLRGLGQKLTDESNTHVLERDLKPLIATVATQLKEQGLIEGSLSPRKAIEVLCAHHVLVNDLDDKQLHFQHHQLQEWYASFYVEELILKAAKNQGVARNTLYENIVNIVAWEESLLFAVERLSRRGEQGVTAIGELVLHTLGIAPMMSANMIVRADKAVWETIKDTVMHFVEQWQLTANSDEVVNFMARTEQPDFAPLVWVAIKQCNADQNKHNSYRFSIGDPGVLGEDAKTNIQTLAAEKRRSLLYDICGKRHYKGLEFVADMLMTETNQRVFIDIVEMLDYYGAETRVAQLLDGAPDELWPLLVEKRTWSIFSQPRYQARLLKEMKTLVNSLPPGDERIQAMIDLDELPDEAYSDQIITDLLKMLSAEPRLPDHLFGQVAKRYPKKLSDAIGQRLSCGKEFNADALVFLLPEASFNQQALLTILRRSSNRYHCKKEVARLLDRDSVSALLNDMLTMRAEARVIALSDRDKARPLWDQAGHLTGILGNVLSDHLAQAVLMRNPTHPSDVAELAKHLSRWGDTTSWQAQLELEPATHDALVVRVREWATLMIDHPKTTRQQLYDLGSLVGCLGAPELLPILQLLVDRRLTMLRHYIKIVEECSNNNTMPSRELLQDARSHPSFHRRAFEGFDCPELPGVLLGYLEESEYRVDAALSLLDYTHKLAGIKKQIEHYPDYSMVAEKRAQLLSGRVTTLIDPLAADLLDHVETLLVEPDTRSLSDASVLALVAAQMNYGRRIDPFLHVLALGGSSELARVLIQNGENVDSEYLLPLIERAEKKFFDSANNYDNWYQIEEALELLAFTNDSHLIIERLLSYPESNLYTHRLHRLIKTLGYSPSITAVSTLKKFLHAFPEISDMHGWCVSLALSASYSDHTLLLDVIFDERYIDRCIEESRYLQPILNAALASNHKVKPVLIEQLKEASAVKQRLLLARMSERDDGIDTDIYLALFEHADPVDEQRTLQCLTYAIQDIATNKQTIDAHVLPRDLTSVRKTLFQVACSASPKSEIAYDMLLEIERVRNEYGRPDQEPRHPDIHSGRAFPREAQCVWDSRVPNNYSGLRN
jgi:NACHT C-terminal Alpha/Beta 2